MIDLAEFPPFLRAHLVEYAGQPVVIGADGRATLPADLAEILGEAIGAEVATSIAAQVKKPGAYRLPGTAELEAQLAQRAIVADLGGNPWDRQAMNLTAQLRLVGENPTLARKLRDQAEASGALAPGALAV
jgi:hypothetical protein